MLSESMGLTMKRKLFIIRYYLSTILIHTGLNVMPESAYKRELLRRLWELRVEVEVAINAARQSNEETSDGEQ